MMVLIQLKKGFFPFGGLGEKMKKNKFNYLFVLQGDYGSGFEDLTQSEDYKEVRTDLKDYRENENIPHRIIKRRELKEVV